MADVRINNVETQINVTDMEALLSPEVMEMLVRAVRQKLNEESRMQQDADGDRRLVEAASG